MYVISGVDECVQCEYSGCLVFVSSVIERWERRVQVVLY